MSIKEAPGVYRIKVPLHNNPLAYVNCYVIETRDGCILIDTGWDTEDAFDALKQGVRDAGFELTQIHHIIVTHIHPDHYGLAGRLEELTGAELIIHESEQQLVSSRNTAYEDLIETSGEWLRINGVPPDQLSRLQQAFIAMSDRVSITSPGRKVRGGERLNFGDVNLEAIWTPGHSAGHICLYNREHKMLFSGDHVLKYISPNISMIIQSESSPLEEYMASLEQLEGLEVNLTLPGHGNTFTSFQERVKELIEHHEIRLDETLKLCKDGLGNAYEIAQVMTWFKPWNEIPPFSQRVAITETLAHLELLISRGLLNKTTHNGLFEYKVSPNAQDDR